MEYALLIGTRGCSLGSDAWFITSDNINGVLPPYYDYSNPPAVVSFDSLGFSRYRLTVEGGAYLFGFRLVPHGSDPQMVGFADVILSLGYSGPSPHAVAGLALRSLWFRDSLEGPRADLGVGPGWNEANTMTHSVPDFVSAALMLNSVHLSDLTPLGPNDSVITTLEFTVAETHNPEPAALLLTGSGLLAAFVGHRLRARQA
jgi:hypothetical protein